MSHKLLKQRRLGHLKVGARTLITAEHLQQFRHGGQDSRTGSHGMVQVLSPLRPVLKASEVPTPETSQNGASGTAETSSVEQRRPTSMAADVSVVSMAAS